MKRKLHLNKTSFSNNLTALSLFFGVFFAVSLFSQSVDALSYYGYTNKFGYQINEVIIYTVYTDTNLTETIRISLVDASGTVFDSKTIDPKSLGFTTNITFTTNLTTASVSSSGDYYVVSNFTYNSTSFESKSLIKIYQTSKFIITTDKAIYSPGGVISFDVRAENSNGSAVSGEPVYVILVSSNYSTISYTNGTTDASGTFSGTFTAPSSQGSYRIVVNDGVSVKLIEVSNFDIIAFTGDDNANTKFKFGTGETAYLYVDLQTANKTSYTGQESVDINITYSNGTTYNISSLNYNGNRVNISYELTQKGAYSARITTLSNSKSVLINFEVADYELKGTFLRGSEEAKSFFQNENITVKIKVFNTSSGDVINTSLTPWNVSILDSNLNFITNVSNSTSKQSDNSYLFYFNTSLSEGYYYLKAALNQTYVLIGFSIKTYIAESVSVDQNYQPKNVFVGNKQNVRVLTTLSSTSGSVNISNISVIDVVNWEGTSVKSSILSFNTSTITYKEGIAGLIEFSAPTDAGWYSIKTRVNNNYDSEAWFLVKLYSVCAQLSDYKWFVSTGDDASITLRVTEAKDVGFIDDISKNTTASSGGNSSIGDNMYGMADCSSYYYTTAGGTSTVGNETAGLSISVSKVINLETMEDVTTKISNLPTNTTNSNGAATLTISKPSGNWEGGSYLLEFSLKDKNNNTDKGFGWFQVKSLWINIWPKQYGGYWKWYFSPNENFTFDVYSYNASHTWYSWSASGNGIGDNCSVISIGYQGSNSEWFWPPKTIESSKYTATCTGSGGRFNLTVAPTSQFKTGYYSIKIKVNTTGGISDVGEGWFNIKAYNVYMRSTSSNYYDSWYKTTSDSLQFDLEVTNASSQSYCYWGSCPDSERVKETLNISIKKIFKYDNWQSKEYNQTKYNVSFTVNGTQTNVSQTNTSLGNATILLTPTGTNNKWETGYYSVIAEVTGSQGTETASSWFEVRKFFVDITVVDSNGTSTSSFRSDGNITLNISASSRPNWFYSSYGENITYYNVTVVSNRTRLMYYSYNDYTTKTVPITISPSQINGTATVTVIPTNTLTIGWYWMDFALMDSEGDIQTGYASFEIKDFTFNAQTSGWRWEYNTTEPIVVDIYVCDPDQYWCSDSSPAYAGNNVSVTVTRLMKTDTWPYTAVSSSSWSATSNQTDSNNNGKMKVTITPSSLSTGSYMAELSAQYTAGGTAQTYQIWFSIRSFTFTAYPVNWENQIINNVTLQMSSSKQVTISAATVSCGYWPNEKTYAYGNNLGFNTTTVNGNTYVKMYPVEDTWTSGYCYGAITATDGSATQNTYVSFNMKAFSVSTYSSTYTYLKNQSVSITVLTDQGQELNVSSITLTNYEQYPYTTYSYYSNGSNSNMNVTPTQFNTNSTLTVSLVSGNWTPGYYSGQIVFVDSTNSDISESAWMSFQIARPLYVYGNTVDQNNNSIYNINQSTEDIRYKVYVDKISTYSSNGVYYTDAPNVSVSVVNITKEDCYSWPCTYTVVSGYTATNATTDASGIAYINITKSGGWAYGSHLVTLFLNDTTNALETTDTAKLWFWVN